MSDYLSNLVSRTLNPGSVIRPRRASLFEPEAATGGPRVHETSEPVQLSREHESTFEKTPPTISANSDRGPRETKVVAEAQSSTREDDRNRLDKRLSDDRRIDVHPEVTQPATTAVPTHQVQSSLLIPTETAKTINQSPENISISSRDDDQKTDRSVTTKEPQTGWSRIERNVRQLIDDRFTGLQPSPTKDNSLVAPQKMDPSPTTTVVTQTPQPVALRSATMALTQPVPATDVAPTIKVTIGRIDVRAVTQSPPVNQPAQKRTVAPQSLDEYLKHRSGVRR